MSKLKGLIGVDEAAKILGLAPGTVKNKCAARELPARKIGKTWVLDKTLLKELIGMTVEFEGKIINLIQDPYIDGNVDERPYYRAVGVDSDGEEYEIVWDVYDNWEEIEDEQDICDWDNPVEVNKL